MSLLAIKKTTQNEDDLIVPRRVYLIPAVPEPFTDEDWFRDAKQHRSYDPNRLPPFQLTIPGGHPSQADAKMRRGLMNKPGTPCSICVSVRSGKRIGKHDHVWLCLSEDTLYWNATYRDVGLKHVKPKKDCGSDRDNTFISRGFSKTLRHRVLQPNGKYKTFATEIRSRRYYLIPVTEPFADRLAAEIIRHAFG